MVTVTVHRYYCRKKLSKYWSTENFAFSSSLWYFLKPEKNLNLTLLKTRAVKICYCIELQPHWPLTNYKFVWRSDNRKCSIIKFQILWIFRVWPWTQDHIIKVKVSLHFSHRPSFMIQISFNCDIKSHEFLVQSYAIKADYVNVTRSYKRLGLK